eukprot:SAG11_NODE_21727_length_419_cov_3.050000_1_plen_48_part_10
MAGGGVSVAEPEPAEVSVAEPEPAEVSVAEPEPAVDQAVVAFLPMPYR